jgi:exosortase
MITGALLLLHGGPRTQRMCFPIAYLIFMVPIPASLTQSIALKLKLFATECAVQLTSLCTLPVVREGSYVHFGNDQLLVGEVCGGLRSLIALLALGALMAYVSRTRAWARILLLALSGPVAVVTNILRISSLCAVAYFYGSDVAAGKFHDISGILIFVVAFVFFFSVDGLLRRLAPLDSKKEKSS